MTRWLAILVVIAACGGHPSRTPEEVPPTYREVRDSAGHRAHIGKVPCAD
jgi:hypothetical protein